MIEKIREYFIECEIIQEDKINVDFLGIKPTQFSIIPNSIEPIIESYIDGSSLRQYQFELISCNEYGIDVIQNMANSTFYEELRETIEDNNKSRILPDIDGIETIECMDSGAILNSQTNKARYSILMRITYLKK